ncbi:unnamed protein product [Parnassius apollo]|uniref:non-specific serine/threonine protein kinase n=1 Tax=Parnassius apollo TaxID=110799 RepID=A0A8S3XP96_PARAO|nr:unnamed protein product [Parnassius apollo]
MSRIRGIDAKVQKNVLQSQQKRKNACNEAAKLFKNEEDACSKEDTEKQQINELLHNLPTLDKIFEVHRKIGEGTFSSVYLGSLRRQTTLPVSERRWFAIKHLVPTAHPARIEHELKCLQDMGGKNNVISVELCLRHFDTIVFVMPYIPHRKFSEYFGEMDASELRQYMRALLVALRHVHSFGVIHRDVKPSNFLYDRENRRYLLVDFGLAQRICVAPDESPVPLNTNKRARDEMEDDSSPGAKRMALDLTVFPKKMDVSTPIPKRLACPPKVQIPKTMAIKEVPGVVAGASACPCRGAPGVCWARGCAVWAAARAPRAGTQGFRPPEVLLKWTRQSAAVDLWAAGVVLATVLANRYPFFRAADDYSALAEVADLLGTDAVQRTAEALGRRVVTSTRRAGLCLRKLSARLRRVPPAPPVSAAPRAGTCAGCQLARDLCLCPDENVPASSFDPDLVVAGFPDSAFALAARLLEPNPSLRITADEALKHPFLATED